jgi:hypothetical protein
MAITRKNNQSILIVKLIKVFAVLIVLFFIIITFNYFQAHKAEFPPGWDFIQHYSAAVLAMQGRAADAYNFHQLFSVESAIAGFQIKLSPFFFAVELPADFSPVANAVISSPLQGGAHTLAVHLFHSLHYGALSDCPSPSYFVVGSGIPGEFLQFPSLPKWLFLRLPARGRTIAVVSEAGAIRDFTSPGHL